MEPRLNRPPKSKGQHNLQTPAVTLNVQCHGLKPLLTEPRNQLKSMYQTCRWGSIPSSAYPSVQTNIRYSKVIQMPETFPVMTRTNTWECGWSLRCFPSVTMASLGASSENYPSHFSATSHPELPTPSVRMVVRWGNPDLRNRGRRTIHLPNPLDIRTDSSTMEGLGPSGFTVPVGSHQRDESTQEYGSKDVMFHG